MPRPIFLRSMFALLFCACVITGCVSMTDGAADGSVSDEGGAVDDGGSPADLAASRADLTPLCGGAMCTMGETCETAAGCCSCGPFARACVAGWTCAMPSANKLGCPAQPPKPLESCTLAEGIACWYCTGGMPLRAVCAKSDFWSECQATGNAKCWAVAGPTRTCD